MKTPGYTKQQINAVNGKEWPGLLALFCDFIALPESWKAHRNTPYDPANTFWLFLGQTVSGNKTCQEVLSKYSAWRAASGLSVPAPDTGAYCKARGRLPLEDLRTIEAHVRTQMDAREEPRGVWRGRRVRVIDGSSLSMPDTPENQGAYPQSRSQKPGCGFPSMHVVVMFSLFTGAIVDFAKDTLRTSERVLFRRMWTRSWPATSC